MSYPRSIELLAPAADLATARQAVLHGADAVYIGGPSHGARSNASNSLDDIRSLVDFAHPFNVRVYVTLNTIVYDSEIGYVEKLIRSLYECGVDALIVQDMGILRMDIPPIELHASTQCHISSPEKAAFLAKVGFSQLVLARELSLSEIRAICNTVDVPVEVFVHGALCVSYSGRCHASCVACGRSANRGECAQICRRSFSLYDNNGKRLVDSRYLLSLKDLNRLDRLEELLEAGVSSFKIEGRLKDVGYVKNTVAAYRRRLDEIIRANPDKYIRSSVGRSEVDFKPDLNKSFNRGFTDFRLDGNPEGELSSVLTPKSLGEAVYNISQLHNGDGISFFDRNGEYTGFRINRIEGNKIITSKNKAAAVRFPVQRTYDREWENMLLQKTADRKIGLSMVLGSNLATATDERGYRVTLPHSLDIQKSDKRPTDLSRIMGKLGDTVYRLDRFDSEIPSGSFVPASQLAALRRQIVSAIDLCALSRYPYGYRRQEDLKAVYPLKTVDYTENISNSLAVRFYEDHGVAVRSRALETLADKSGKRLVMTSRHCILRDMGKCLRTSKNRPALPLRLVSGNLEYEVEFDCRNCLMKLYS